MHREAVRNLILVQVVSITGLIACVALKPHGLVADSGVSYFGNFKLTIIPYAFALLGGAWFLYKAAQVLPVSEYRLTKVCLNFFAILCIGVFATPYSVSNLVDWAHKIVGITLFSAQLILTAWITIKSNFNNFLCTVWVCEFLAGVLCAIYTPTPTGYLLECQVLFQIAFTIFYVKYLGLNKSTHRYIELKTIPFLNK